MVIVSSDEFGISGSMELPYGKIKMSGDTLGPRL